MPRRTQTYAIRLAVERAKLDTERLERAAYLPLELLADADKAITRAKERSQPVAGQALDVNLAEPTGARQLRQSLGIGGVRLVEPRKEHGAPGGHRHTRPADREFEADGSAIRELSALQHDPHYLLGMGAAVPSIACGSDAAQVILTCRPYSGGHANRDHAMSTSTATCVVRGRDGDYLPPPHRPRRALPIAPVGESAILRKFI
jgi:hypothetical protein